jgi:UDP-N-acetylglucosamine pyrophosphorylase
MNLSAIIMAGGKGTRFAGDGPKCLAPLRDGSTLLKSIWLARMDTALNYSTGARSTPLNFSWIGWSGRKVTRATDYASISIARIS